MQRRDSPQQRISMISCMQPFALCNRRSHRRLDIRQQPTHRGITVCDHRYFIDDAYVFLITKQLEFVCKCIFECDVSTYFKIMCAITYEGSALTLGKGCIDAQVLWLLEGVQLLKQKKRSDYPVGCENQQHGLLITILHTNTLHTLFEISHFGIFFLDMHLFHCEQFYYQMEKYQIIDKAGSGNFSDVYRARQTKTGDIVAIKYMKDVDHFQQLALKELKILSSLDHTNIIKLKEIIKNNRDVRVVFQYMDQNLLQLYQSMKVPINENQMKCILYQCALALEYLHGLKIIHRDIKPENILINRKTALVKLIDFGLAKEEYLASTDYVATRWYRSPENIIGLKNSTTAMDIFALGCVAVQLYSLKPLFPGDDTIDQLQRIFSVLGIPTIDDWPKGYQQLKNKNIRIIINQRKSLRSILNGASNQLIDLLEKMLVVNPDKRITAKNMLKHSFFKSVENYIPQFITKKVKQVQRHQLRKIRSPAISIRAPDIPRILIQNITVSHNAGKQSPLKYSTSKPFDQYTSKQKTKTESFVYDCRQKLPIKIQNPESLQDKRYSYIANSKQKYIFKPQQRRSIYNPSTDRILMQTTVTNLKYVPQDYLNSTSKQKNRQIESQSINRSLERSINQFSFNSSTINCRSYKNIIERSGYSRTNQPYKRTTRRY